MSMAYQMRLVLHGNYERKDSEKAQEDVTKLVCLGARDPGTDWKIARTDGSSGPDGRGSVGGDLGHWT